MDGWTIKILAGLALTLAGALAGRAFAVAGKKREKQLGSLCQAVARLPIAMLDKRMPLEAALNSVGSEAFSATSRLIRDERSVESSWKTALAGLRTKSGAFSALEGEEIAALDEMFASLGTTGAQEQRLLLEESRALLEGIWLKAKKKSDEQAKLYSTLGLLTGLAIAILLM